MFLRDVEHCLTIASRRRSFAPRDAPIATCFPEGSLRSRAAQHDNATVGGRGDFCEISKGNTTIISTIYGDPMIDLQMGLSGVDGLRQQRLSLTAPVTRTKCRGSSLKKIGASLFQRMPLFNFAPVAARPLVRESRSRRRAGAKNAQFGVRVISSFAGAFFMALLRSRLLRRSFLRCGLLRRSLLSGRLACCSLSQGSSPLIAGSRIDPRQHCNSDCRLISR